MYRSTTNRLIHITKHLTRPTAYLHTVSRTMASTPAITLYTAQTPNGIKISIVLEELGLPYTTRKIDFAAVEQKEPWFLKITPNGRIPAITDTSFADGKPLNVFESGAILEYLIETYDKEHKISYPKGSREDWEIKQWLYFQNAGVGPMQGQANHFFRAAPEKNSYAITRYVLETERLYGILDKQLAASSNGFLVGDRLTIADITSWGWVSTAPWVGIDLKRFPALEKWRVTIGERPAVKKGASVPEPSKIMPIFEDPAKMAELAKEVAEWVVRT